MIILRSHWDHGSHNLITTVAPSMILVMGEEKVMKREEKIMKKDEKMIM